MKKAFILTLVLLLLTLISPVFATEFREPEISGMASVADATRDAIGMGHLLKGYNPLEWATHDQVILGSSLADYKTKSHIFSQDQAVYNLFPKMFNFSEAGFGNAHTESNDASSTEQYAANFNISLEQSSNREWDFGFEAGVEKIAKGSIGYKNAFAKKIGADVALSYANSSESHFHITYTKFQKAAHSFDYVAFFALPEESILSMLDSNFKADLLDISYSARSLFDKYGTHFIVQYGMGGFTESYANYTYTSTSGYDDRSPEYEELCEILESIATGVGGKYDRSLQFTNIVNTLKTSSGYRKSTQARMYGGFGGIITNYDNMDVQINNWISSFNKPDYFNDCIIFSDDNLEMVGIWELIPVKAEYEQRYYDLVRTFHEMQNGMDLQFANSLAYRLSGSPITAEVKTAQEYATYLNSKAIIPIENFEQFAKIGNPDFKSTYPINGQYILIKDLNLKGAAQTWLQQNSDVPFSGVFDANGCTISYYEAVKDSFSTRQDNIGIFPYITGTVKNLLVRNSKIQYDNSSASAANLGSPVVYNAGIVVGKNGGIVQNCRVEDSMAKVYLYTKGAGHDTHVTVNVGGVVGVISGNGVIRNCCFTNMSGLDNQNKVVWAEAHSEDAHADENSGKYSYSKAVAGGVVGELYGGMISDSYAKIRSAGVHAAVKMYTNHSDYNGLFPKHYRPVRHAFSGGVVGGSSGTILRCYSQSTGSYGTATNYIQVLKGGNDRDKNVKPTGDVACGEIAGASVIEGTVTDCFYKSGLLLDLNWMLPGLSGIIDYTIEMPAIGMSGSQVPKVHPVDTFKEANIRNALHPVYGWDNDSVPVLLPIEKTLHPVFVIEYLGDKPQFHVGDVIPSLSKLMKVSFTSSDYVSPVVITNKVEAKYDFSKPGEALLQLIYRQDENTVYRGIEKLQVSVFYAAPESVDIVGTPAMLNAGDSMQLSAVIYPVNASNKAVRWESNDSDVVVVNANGIVYAKKDGTAFVTAITVDGGIQSALYAITVVSPQIIAVNPSEAIQFTPLVVGYTTSTPISVEVLNISNQPTGPVSLRVVDDNGTENANLVLSKTLISNIDAGMGDSFTVVPKQGLGVGTYEAKIVLVSKHDDPLIIPVHFTVENTKPAITLSNTEGKPGDVVSIHILAEDRGIVLGAFEFEVEYSPTNLEYAGYTLPDISYLNVLTISTPNGNQRVMLSHIDGSSDFELSGDFITLNFLVLPNAKDGTYPVSISSALAENRDGQPVYFNYIPGYVTISTFEYGDFTGRGLLTGTDALWIRRYVLAGHDMDYMLTSFPTTINTFNPSAASFTNRTFVSGTDALWLQRYILTGYDAQSMIELWPTAIDFSHLYPETTQTEITTFIQPSMSGLFSLDMPTITVGDSSAKHGETITVPITIENSSVLLGSLSMVVEFDKSALGYEGFYLPEGSNLSPNVLALGNGNSIRLMFNHKDGTSDFDPNGVLVYLSFKLSDTNFADADIRIATQGLMAEDRNGELVSYDIRGGKITFERQPCNHEWHPEVTITATCKDEGVLTFTCLLCKDTYTESIQMLAHTEAADYKAPTCDADGYDNIICKVCGEVIQKRIIEALGHHYESRITMPSTCMGVGTVSFSCLDCVHEMTEELPIDPTNHLGNTYEGQIQAATAEENGVMGVYCLDCRTELSRKIIPAIGHNYQSGITREPSCQLEGILTFTCQDCDKSYDEPIDKLPHSHLDVSKASTCAEQGYDKILCAICDEVISFTALPKLDHVYDEGTVFQSATCSLEGLMQHLCLNCDHSVAEPIAKLPHSEVEDSNAATCSHDGYEKTICLVCKTVITEKVIPKLEHVYDEAVVIEESSCDTEGQARYTCIECEHSTTKTIEKTTHSPSEKASCLHPQVCLECDEVLKPALGHDWDNGVISTAASTSSEGVMTFACLNDGCEAAYTEAIPRLTYSDNTGNYYGGGTSSTATNTDRTTAAPPNTSTSKDDDVEDGKTQTTNAIADSNPNTSSTRISNAMGDNTTDEGDGLITFTENETPLADLPRIETTKNALINPFIDVPENEWFYDVVMYVYKAKLMSGTAENLFSPNMELTRGMIVTVLYRMEGSPDVGELANIFSDVDEHAYYYEAVKWASENSLIVGYEDGTYNPEAIVSRQDLATIMVRYANHAAITLPYNREYVSFADDGLVSDYARSSIEACYTAELIGGKPNNMLDPLGGATRAEFAAILSRLLALGTITEDKAA